MQRRRSKKPEELTPDKARATAMRLLARGEHSAMQLRRKLESRGFATQTCVDILDEMTESGWQSDARFAEVLCRSRSSQGHGPQRIHADLKQAGVSDDLARSAFEGIEEDFVDIAKRLHKRRFGSVPKRGREWQKQYRFLAGRGFTSDQIRSVLKGDPEDEF